MTKTGNKSILASHQKTLIINEKNIYRQTSIQRTIWEAKSTVRCIEIRFIENAWKKMRKFFKRNLGLDLIHFLKILIYFADNDIISKINVFKIAFK